MSKIGNWKKQSAVKLFYPKICKGNNFFFFFLHKWLANELSFMSYMNELSTVCINLSRLKTGPNVVFFPGSGHMAGNLLLCLGRSSTTTVVTCGKMMVGIIQKFKKTVMRLRAEIRTRDGLKTT